MNGGSNSQTLKRVLRFLVKHQKLCQEEEENYISNIKKELGLSKTTVQRAISNLEELGAISDRKRKGEKKVIYVSQQVVEQLIDDPEASASA